MTDISRHYLLKQAYEVCQEIEKCGASPQLTNAVTKASDLMRALDTFIPAVGLETNYPLFVVREGDTLSAIAQQMLGSSGLFPLIQQLNVELIKDAGHIEAGWVIKLPFTSSPAPATPSAFIDKKAQVPLATEAQPLWYGVDLAAADFSDALMWLKEGKRVQRAGWNGKGLWLEYRASLGTVDLPYIQLIYPVPGDGSLPYPNGARVPWAPSQTDMLADDWRVVS